MKRSFLILPFLVAALCCAASAQNQTRNRRVTQPGANQGSDSVSTPEKEANHVEKRSAANGQLPAASDSSAPSNGPDASASQGGTSNSEWGNAPVVNTPGRSVAPSTRPSDGQVNTQKPTKLIERTALSIDPLSTRGNSTVPASRTNRATVSPAPNRPLAATEEYRIGVGDVLDVRVVDMPTRESTLFTVLTGGTIEYPLLNQPLIVAGLTTEQIAARLQNEIKVIDNPQLTVNVRDYASHAVVVSGWVDNPGRKMLRREAMPLYAVLAEALPRAEASTATIVRAQHEQQLSLNDQKAMATLLLPGDIVKISGEASAARKFFYVGGQVNSPGERDFREGMTLTQAILACGGAARDAGKSVKVSRRNADGFLVAIEYDLHAISDGKSPDPLLQSGDRIEVGRIGS